MPLLEIDEWPDNFCSEVVGMARNATQDVLVCGRKQPCPEHADEEEAA